MAKAKGNDARKGRPPLSPSGATKPSTYRISPSGDEVIRALSDRLDLRSQAAAIEMATRQMILTLERLDARPPLDPRQLERATTAIRAAGIEPRRLGPAVNFPAILLAAVMSAEATLVPGDCTAGEYAALIDSVRRFTPAEALWVIAAAAGE